MAIEITALFVRAKVFLLRIHICMT